MIFYALSLTLIALAAAANAVMDTIRYHWPRSVFAGLKSARWRNWWFSDWLDRFEGRDPKRGIRNIHGTTIDLPAPVWDGWHAAKAVMIGCVAAALVMAQHVPSVPVYVQVGMGIGYLAVWGGVFELMFGKILMRKGK